MTDFFPFAQQIAGCIHRDRCRGECGFMPLERPAPDYFGPRYDGLVVVGANPGIASNATHQKNDARTMELQNQIANGNGDAFNELMRFLPESMVAWKQVVNSRGRRYLDYDIEEIAYINLVKCATTKQNSDIFKLFTGGASEIPKRCWEAHTEKQLAVLQPTFVVALWTPILDNLRRLGYQFGGVQQTGSYNGQRNLTTERKYEGAKTVFDSYRRRGATTNL